MQEISIVVNTQNHVEQHSQSNAEPQFLNQSAFLALYSETLIEKGVLNPEQFWNELAAYKHLEIGVEAAKVCVENARLLVPSM